MNRPTSNPALLEVRDLRKSFGGIAATDAVSLDVLRGETHAVIGPNGAGKTTFVSQVSGLLVPDAGSIRFDGRDITRMPAHRRARFGLARSFQITSVFMDMTVSDNVAFAVQARAGHSFRFWTPARSIRRLRDTAQDHLATTGLAERADDLASVLSHGERRQLEVAMALATEPQLLLLDEPTAGMSADETARMIETLRDLKKTKTILLVEHDMDAVFALADRISVLVHGRLIATGTPDEIRNDADVARAYLGDTATC
jgi:branched-chain amino acid transport system ATP-binding protein